VSDNRAYYVKNDVRIIDRYLEIQAGAKVFFNEGKRIITEGSGLLEAKGSLDSPIYFLSVEKFNARHKGIKLNGHLILKEGGWLRVGE
jgi:hypothetical protein